MKSELCYRALKPSLALYPEMLSYSRHSLPWEKHTSNATTFLELVLGVALALFPFNSIEGDLPPIFSFQHWIQQASLVKLPNPCSDGAPRLA